MSNISMIFKGDVKDRNVGKRITRFLDEDFFDISDIGAVFIDLLPQKMKVTLSIDASYWESENEYKYILVVGLCLDGVTLVIDYDFYTDVRKTGAQVWIALVSRVIKRIGDRPIRCILGDREFGSADLIKFLKANNIPFGLRLRENLKVISPTTGKEINVADLFSTLEVGDHKKINNVHFSKMDFTCNVYGAKRIGRDGKPSLMILASPPEFDVTQDSYLERWSLERTFFCYKSNGYNIEKSKYTGNRFRNLLNIVTIVYNITVYLGYLRDLVNPIRYVDYHTTQGDIRAYKEESIFMYGQRVIRKILSKWNVDKQVIALQNALNCTI